MEKMKVFCLPYAGGSKAIYYDWKKNYEDVADIIPVEYSGHGSRYGGELYCSVDKIVDDVYEQITKVKPSNYILYGHSMGSLIATLTCLKLEQKYKYKPKAIVIGGTRPPHLKYKDESYVNLPKDQFMKKIYELGQTSEEIMNEPELLEIFYEILYADIYAFETYKQKGEIKVECPMYVATGLEDKDAPLDDMKEWEQYTNNTFNIERFNGSHFFPFNCDSYLSYLRNVITLVSK